MLVGARQIISVVTETLRWWFYVTTHVLVSHDAQFSNAKLFVSLGLIDKVDKNLSYSRKNVSQARL